ncbi:MAG TPA: phytanoyl-CoA dioxygenase family protein [Drouetiella sp.]|jgi:ectoine hydroxylase-related dioxygenase (phytanoyl-CoA dioxygenase family)
MVATQTSSNLDVQVDAVKSAGYAVLPAVLTADQIKRARAILLEIFAQEKKRGSRENWENPQYQISLCLPAKHKFFRELCATWQILEFARLLLGEDCVVTSMNGFTTKPNGVRQPLHLDFFGDRKMLTSLLFILCLDDFTAENGGTRVVPYSQRKHGREKSFEFLEDQAVTIEAPAGSILVYDADLVHSAGFNQSTDFRLCLHIVYSLAWIKPQWDIALSMPKGLRDRLTKSERALFGIDNHPFVLDSYTGRPIDFAKSGRLVHYVKQLRSKLTSGL